MLARALLLLFLLGGLWSCTHSSGSESFGYDRKSLRLATLNLFNQRLLVNKTDYAWKGDWLMRRIRLEQIDLELRRLRPDIFVMQEALNKIGSDAENDQAIFTYGALRGYDFDLVRLISFEDTQEEQRQGLASFHPLRLYPSSESISKFSWEVGINGYLSLHQVESEGQIISIFILQMPAETKAGIWSQYLGELIGQIVEERKICRERMVLVSSLLNQAAVPELANFLNLFGLKDSSQNRAQCEIASSCFTASQLNDLFIGSSGNANPGQTERIYVPRSALVLTSELAFNHAAELNPPYLKEHYNLGKNWPSRTFGWVSDIQFARCPSTL